MHVRVPKWVRLPPRPLVVKAAKRSALAVAVAYLAYLLIINLALRIDRELDLPEAVHVTFASAWSWYPGQVQARDVRVVGHDSHVEWQLDAEHVRLRWSLTALLHRRFQASAIRGGGIAMRIRRTLDAGAITPAALEGLPPIAGLPDPPTKPATPSPPIADAEYRLWSVDLEDVDVNDVRELWFDAYRFVGEAHVTGSFALRPLRMARVGPASVDVAQGELRIAKETALEGLTGHLDATVAAFDPRDIDGAGFLRYLTVAARGDGRIASVRFVRHYLADASGLAFDGGAGPAHVDVHVVDGVLAAPTAVAVDVERAVVTLGEHRASASARIALAVDPTPARPEASLSAVVTELDVVRPPAEAPILRAARIVALGRRSCRCGSRISSGSKGCAERAR